MAQVLGLGWAGAKWGDPQAGSCSLSTIALPEDFCSRTCTSSMWAMKSHHFHNRRTCVARGLRHRWLSQACMQHSATIRPKGHLAAFTPLVPHLIACLCPFTGGSLPVAGAGPPHAAQGCCASSLPSLSYRPSLSHQKRVFNPSYIDLFPGPREHATAHFIEIQLLVASDVKDQPEFLL